MADLSAGLNVTWLAPTMDGVGASPTLVMNERYEALRRTGRPLYKLGFGQSPFPVPTSVVDALKMHAHEKDYLAARGLLALRDAVALHHRELQHLECTAADIVIGWWLARSGEARFALQPAGRSSGFASEL